MLKFILLALTCFILLLPVLTNPTAPPIHPISDTDTPLHLTNSLIVPSAEQGNLHKDTTSSLDSNTITSYNRTETSKPPKVPFSESLISLLKHFFGLFLILSSIVLLWFNEKKAVEMSRIMNFGEKACEEIKPDQYDSELNGELVHITGKVSTACSLHDQTFGVQIKDAVKLKRVVQVFQVREIKKGKGKMVSQDVIEKKAKYQYENAWCEYSIPSAGFIEESMKQCNDNAKFIAYKMIFTANTVDLGNYRLTPYQIERLDDWVPLQLEGSSGITFSRDMKERLKNLGWEKQVVEVNGNCVMIKQGEGDGPQVGDIKVSFYQLPCDTVTVISEQAGITFRPYNIKERRFIKKSESEKASLLDEEEQKFDQALEKSIDRCCWGMFCCWMDNSRRNPMRVRETIDWIYPGQLSKKEFFTSQIKVESKYLINVTRVFCTGLLIVGLYMSFDKAIGKLVVVKLLTKVIGWAGFMSDVCLGVIGSLIVSGFAWIFYRRWVGLGIVLCAASMIGIIFVCQELRLE